MAKSSIWKTTFNLFLCFSNQLNNFKKSVGAKVVKFFSFIFKDLALWADSFYKSKCMSVCLSVPF